MTGNCTERTWFDDWKESMMEGAYVNREPERPDPDQGRKVRDEIATVLAIYDRLEGLPGVARVRVLKYVEQLLADSL